MRVRILLAVLIAGSLAVVLACGGSSSSTTLTPTSPSTSTPPPGSAGVQTGSLSVAVKDSPYSDATALLVTFSEVSVHSASTDSWIPLTFTGGATTRTCDLKKLVTAQDVLGTGTLTAGHYTQIRLTVSSATVYFGGTSSAACAPEVTITGTTETSTHSEVTIPSGTLKLIQEFDVPAGGATTILLDFDGDKSVNQTGNGAYKMSPVIKVVSVQ